MITRKYEKISLIKSIKNILLNKIKHDKSYNSFIRKKTIFKNKQKILNNELDNNSDLYKTYSLLKEKKNKIKKENNSFKDLYNITKKNYKQNVQNIFFNIIKQYQNKNYNIPDLSINKNIFKQNPLLLKDEDIEYYYLSYKFKKIEYDTLQKYKNKHLLFLNKQNDILNHTKNIIQEKNLMKNKDNKIKYKRNDISDNDSNCIKKAFSYTNFKVNYRNNNNLKINLNKAKSEENDKIKYKKIDININNKNDFKDKLKIDENIIKRLNKINNIRNKNINKNLNSINSFSLPSLPTFSDKSPFPKKIQILKKNIKSKTTIIVKNNKNNTNIKNNNNNNINNINTNENRNNKITITKKSSMSETNLKDFERRKKIYQINIKKLMKQSNNKEIIKNLLDIKNQRKFLEKIQKINIIFFNKKELEEIIEYYCREFLRFNDIQIKNIFKAKNSDIDMEILNLINTFVKKNNRIMTNLKIKKENNFLSYNLIKDIDNKAYKLQKTMIKNQANDD